MGKRQEEAVLLLVSEDPCTSYKMPAKVEKEGASPGADQTAL